MGREKCGKGKGVLSGASGVGVVICDMLLCVLCGDV